MPIDRPVDWRWLRVVELLDSGSRPQRGEDRHVQRGCRFLRRLRGCDPRGEERLMWQYRDLYEAHQIYDTEGAPHLKAARWIVEAGILSGQPLEHLGQYLKADVDTLATYEAMYFDVRDALGDRDYVIANVLWPEHARGASQEKDLGLACKWLAYLYGWETVRAVLESVFTTPTAETCVRRALVEAAIRELGGGVPGDGARRRRQRSST